MLKAVRFLLAGVVFLSGCSSFSVRVPGVEKGSAPKAAAPAPAVSKEEAALEQALLKAQTTAETYKISSADLLEISVYQEKDLERKVRVGPDGMITFPLIGAVKVGGLSVPEAEQAILGRLRKFLINPQVSVFVKEYGNKIIYVLGEVAKPGSYSLPTEATLTVLEAISLAGGFTQYAAGDRTRIIRKASGKRETLSVNVSDITKRSDKTQDLPLQPNDVVFVPETMF